MFLFGFFTMHFYFEMCNSEVVGVGMATERGNFVSSGKACQYSPPHSLAMVDVTAKLSSLSFESGLSEEEKKLLHLRARAAGLTFCGCAHAPYLCKVMRSLRLRHTVAPAEGAVVCVGIRGAGQLGKQLLLSLLETTGIKPSHIKVSTRTPESAVKCSQTGVECFFDNGRLAAWADVVFLCCLPSHLHTVCADLLTRLSKHCLIYSFISAVPVTRWDFSECELGVCSAVQHLCRSEIQ
uniref:NADP-dependent oxidoreductase domain-containing protein 1 n=1 Tax=Solea senegalensis TaxID=28829 RepID=UPI001CD82072|nr:NADP-dependent oxidoreductase domain-containing protein 1 [Solea senegalensis]